MILEETYSRLSYMIIYVCDATFIILNLCIQEDFQLVVLVDFYCFLDFPHLFPQTSISVAFIEKIIGKVCSHLKNCSQKANLARRHKIYDKSKM